MSEWTKTPCNLFAPSEVVTRVAHLRRLMLVHSCIYYEMNTNVVDDHRWQEWADELFTLQMLYGSTFGFYDQAFSDWTAATGCHLPLNDPDVANAAKKLLRITAAVDLFAA